LFVFAVLVLAGAGASVTTWALQRRAAAAAAAGQELDERLDRMITATSELGATLQAYVAPGQVDDASFARVSDLVKQLTDDIAAVAARARSAETAGILHTASESIASFVQLDTRLRENLRLGEELIAADVIFGDGRKALSEIATPLRGVRGAERAASATVQAALLQRIWNTLGAAALLWLAGLALLVRLPASRQAAAPPVAAGPSPIADTWLTQQSAAPARPPVDLAAAADVCVAIARMTASVELPALLARAASVVDASGIIVWVGGDEELFAAAAHGYDPSVIARLGSIGRNADNATAASWRSGEVRIVPGDIISDGAVVAPMLRPDGCIGVLAAELRHGKETDAATRAVTVMFAAQLAAVVSASPPGSAEGEGEAGRAEGERGRAASV
jgi:hypothetical protein